MTDKPIDLMSALPETPDGVTARVQAALTVIDKKRRTRGAVMRRRLIGIAAAAAVLTVAAGFTVYAAVTGEFDKPKEEAEAAVASFDYEQTKATWKEANWTPWALVNKTAEVNGQSFTLTELMLYKQNEPDFYLTFQLNFDRALDTLRPELDTLTLTVDGVEASTDAFCTDEWNAGGVWEDGQRYADIAYLYEDRFPVGSEIALCGMLHTYDADGAVTGEYGELALSFTLTQQMVEDMTEKNAAEMAAYESDAVSAENEWVSRLPSVSTHVNVEQNGVTLHEVSLEDSTLYLSLTVPAAWRVSHAYAWRADALYLCGVYCMADIYAVEEGENGDYTYYLGCPLPYAAEALPEIYTVALLPTAPYEAVGGKGEYGLMFRFDPATQKVAMPDAAELAVWTQEWAAMENTLPTAFDIDETLTAGNITVQVARLELTEGRWTLYAYLTGNRDYHTPQEYAPVISAGGAQAAVRNEYERYAYLEPTLEGGEGDGTPVFWELELPVSPDADGRVRLVMDWDIYDRADDGSAYLAGTVHLDKTL